MPSPRYSDEPGADADTDAHSRSPNSSGGPIECSRTKSGEGVEVKGDGPLAGADKDALTAVLGQTEVDTRRTASSHLSYLALHDLILLEKDPITRFKYQKLFEEQYRPMRSDGISSFKSLH